MFNTETSPIRTVADIYAVNADAVSPAHSKHVRLSV